MGPHRRGSILRHPVFLTLALTAGGVLCALALLVIAAAIARFRSQKFRAAYHVGFPALRSPSPLLWRAGR
jgi:hypothetical protein